MTLCELNIGLAPKSIERIANLYLDRGMNAVKRYIIEEDEYYAGNCCWKTDLVFPDEIHTAIMVEAYARGWDGFHGENPLNVCTTYYEPNSDPEFSSGFEAFQKRYCNQH